MASAKSSSLPPRRPLLAVAAAAALGVLGLTGCPSTPAPHSAGPGLDGYDDTRLQLLVREGLRSLTPEPCKAALMLGVLDDEDAGLELDHMLARSAERPAPVDCAETIAAARLVRRGRLGEIDLLAEMTSASPVARAVAIRFALGASVSEDIAQTVIARGLADEHVDVRIVAYRAAAALGRAELLAPLQAKSPVDAHEAFWHCIAQSRLGAELTCADPSAVRAVLDPGEVAPTDRCERAESDLQTPDRDRALWFYLASAFRERVNALDRLELSRRSDPPCRMDEAFEDSVLSSPNSPLDTQAMVAATLLWRRHEDVGVLRERRVALRELAQEQLVDYCTQDGDCPGNSACWLAPGRENKGICGSRRAAPERPRASVYMTVGSNACWSFMDCPPFYSCHYPDPFWPHGVCVY